MKKFVCILLGLLCVLPTAACHKKDSNATRIWCIKPSDIAAEEELRHMVRQFDADAFVSFIPENEIGMRLSAAMQRDEAPDVFMLFTDALPDLAEEKQALGLSNRLPTSNIQTDAMSEAARRACLYQGKTWGVPLFVDTYMLATNRALVSTPPQTAEQLLGETQKLSEQGVAAFAKLTPEKQSILFEALLQAQDGSMLNTRRTKLTFADEKGEAAMNGCTQLLKDAAPDADAIGSGKAAFSIMTTADRRKFADDHPDAEIELSPLFGYERLQTVALAINASTDNQKRSFKMLEYLQSQNEKIATLYKYYAATKDVQPITPQDKDAVVHIAEARPAPDLCGFATLETTYLPAAIDKAGKGVPAVDALTEAEQQASGMIWKGKRE